MNGSSTICVFALGAPEFLVIHDLLHTVLERRRLAWCDLVHEVQRIHTQSYFYMYIARGRISYLCVFRPVVLSAPSGKCARHAFGFRRICIADTKKRESVWRPRGPRAFPAGCLRLTPLPQWIVLWGYPSRCCRRVLKVRDVANQLDMGVPEEHLAGHAFHTYSLKSNDGT